MPTPQEQWDAYLAQLQSGATDTSPQSPLDKLLAMFGGGGMSGGSNQGFGQPGPAAPIDYDRMRSILNSGVLRQPQAGGAAPVAPAPVQQPAPAPPPRPIMGGLLGSLLARLNRG